MLLVSSWLLASNLLSVARRICFADSLFHPKNGDSTFLQIIVGILPDYSGSQCSVKAVKNSNPTK